MAAMRVRLPVITLLLLVPLGVQALRFPDVPANYAHKIAIQELSDAGVINGNPDGTFRPRDPVNRAAMLKMLYVAAKVTPEKAGGCFTDVQQGSWYEFYVCDAAIMKYVQGYGGGLFKPGQPVTRAEALKITLTVLGLEENTEAAVEMYIDVQESDWYSPYIHTALSLSILPIPGQDGLTFSPNQILERGEAAAYIWNATQARRSLPASSSSSSLASPEDAGTGPAAGTSTSAMAELEKRAAAARRVMEQEQKALELAQANTVAVAIPFSDKGTFGGKTPFSYEFSLAAPLIVEINSSIVAWNSGSLTCRLYHLGRSGFSQEYYLGFQDGKNCIIRGALAPGSWRLQLAPEQANTDFTVSAKVTKGDGNDGFSQAAALPLAQVRSDSLEAGDLEDWYTFTVAKDLKTVENGGRELTLKISSSELLGCLIYPMDDVDQYGFAGPQCGSKYLYPPGTYVVSVRHAIPLTVRQTYSIQVK